MKLEQSMKAIAESNFSDPELLLSSLELVRKALPAEIQIFEEALKRQTDKDVIVQLSSLLVQALADNTKNLNELRWGKLSELLRNGNLNYKGTLSAAKMLVEEGRSEQEGVRFLITCGTGHIRKALGDGSMSFDSDSVIVALAQGLSYADPGVVSQALEDLIASAATEFDIASYLLLAHGIEWEEDSYESYFAPIFVSYLDQKGALASAAAAAVLCLDNKAEGVFRCLDIFLNSKKEEAKVLAKKALDQVDFIPESLRRASELGEEILILVEQEIVEHEYDAEDIADEIKIAISSPCPIRKSLALKLTQCLEDHSFGEGVVRLALTSSSKLMVREAITTAIDMELTPLDVELLLQLYSNEDEAYFKDLLIQLISLQYEEPGE